MKTQLILTTLIAYFGVAPTTPNQLVEEVVTGGINDSSRVQENFRHLFDSLAKNDMQKTGAYRSLLERVAAKEEQAFHTMKEELQSARQKNAFAQRNVYSKDGDVGRNVVPFKRETPQVKKNRGVSQNMVDYENVTIADLEQRDEKGRTLLHVAAYLQNISLVDYLIQSGADVHARDGEGRTPLHWAAYGGDVPTASLLLHNGADILLTDNRGRTPLHMATLTNEPGMVHYLLHSGAKFRALDNDGKQAIDLTRDRYVLLYLKNFILEHELAKEERLQLSIPLSKEIDDPDKDLPATYT